MAVQNFNKGVTVKASLFGKIIWYLSFIFIIPIFIHVGNVNSIRRMQEKINQADSDIEVQLIKRRDLLLKLVDTVKASMNFEKITQTQVARLRSQNVGNSSMEEKLEINNTMNELQKGINIQLEAYPDLKATQNVLHLQRTIRDVEDDISASRRIYNSNASVYNQSIRSYPMNVAADNLDTYPFFKATEAEQQDVKIDLGF